jgi:hypothetical protein
MANVQRINLRMPGLFSSLLNYRPSSFAPRIVGRMHAQFEGICRDALKEVAQVELPRIEPEFLRSPAYAAKAREIDPHQTMGDQFEFAHAFAVFKMRGDNLVASLYYDLDGLSHCKGPTSAVMVHEVASTVYGKQIEALQRGSLRAVKPEESIVHLGKDLSSVSGGWAQLLTQMPLSLPELLVMEQGYHYLDMLPKEDRPGLQKALKHGPNFISLALPRIEKAYGIGPVASLMREIPGIKIPALGRMEGTLQEVWKQYDRANRLLSLPSIPFEAFSGGGFDQTPDSAS